MCDDGNKIYIVTVNNGHELFSENFPTLTRARDYAYSVVSIGRPEYILMIELDTIHGTAQVINTAIKSNSSIHKMRAMFY